MSLHLALIFSVFIQVSFIKLTLSHFIYCNSLVKSDFQNEGLVVCIVNRVGAISYPKIDHCYDHQKKNDRDF